MIVYLNPSKVPNMVSAYKGFDGVPKYGLMVGFFNVARTDISTPSIIDRMQ